MSDNQSTTETLQEILEVNPNAKKKKKQMAVPTGIFEETVSTYRIFSRAFCNFVFPEEIGRPIPGDDELDED